MEKKIGFYQADLIEHATEYLRYRVEHWILDGRPLTEDIKNFVAWCRAQDEKDLHCKRGQDGKSFYERREEGRKAIREHCDSLIRDMEFRKRQREEGES